MRHHPFLRPVTLCTVLVLLWSCKNSPETKKTPDADLKEETVQVTKTSAPAEFPMVLPPHTAGLMTIDLRRTEDFVTQLVATFPPEVQNKLQRESPSQVTSHFLLALTSSMLSREMRRDERNELVEQFDPNGKIHVALSLQGTEPMLEAMRLGVPLQAYDTALHGPLVRISLPARDPDRLRQVLQKRAKPQTVERIEIVSGQVEIDIRTRSADAIRMSKGLKPFDIDTSSDTDYLKDQSAALHTFLKSDAAIKVHMPSSSTLPLAALMGIEETHQALEYAVPEVRETLRRSGYRIAAQAMIYETSSTQEVHDTTLLMDMSPENHLAVSIVRSLTSHGKKLNETLFKEPMSYSKSKLDMPLFAFAAAQPTSRLQDVTGAHGELALIEDRRKLVQELGPAVLFARMMQAPLATRSSLSESNTRTTPFVFSESMSFQMTLGDLSAGPRTAKLVVDLDMPTPPPKQLSQIVSDWADFVPRRLDDMYSNIDGPHVLLSANADPRGTTTTVPFEENRFASGRLDFIKFAALLRTLPEHMKREISPAMLTQMERLASVQMTARYKDNHTIWHAQTGAQDLTPTVSSSTPLPQPSATSLPECLIPIIHRSRQTLEEFDGSDTPYDVSTRVLESFPEAIKTCPEAQPQLERMQAHWLVARGLIGGHPTHDDTDLQNACNLGLETACQLQAH